ncbi:hypothetical protein MTO96_029407, partial [Rhipicephalus appendiculatus]
MPQVGHMRVLGLIVETNHHNNITLDHLTVRVNQTAHLNGCVRSGHVSSTRGTMPHAQLFFAPQIVLMLTLLSPSAPGRICPTGGVHHDAVRNRHELVNHTCDLPKFPSFLDVPLDGHLFASQTSSPNELLPFPSPFKSNLLSYYPFSGHVSSTRGTMPHAQLFFAPQIVLMLTLLSPSAPGLICPTGGVHHDAVRNRHELVNHTCDLPKFPSFLDVPLDGHLFASQTSSPNELLPFPSPFKSNLLS